MDAPLNLAELDAQLLLPGTKGLPLRAPMRQSDVGLQNWSLLNGDLSYPVAVLKQSALDNNGRWMAQFVASAGASLAPHGKTTMSPQLFEMQRAAGAWAITVANVTQLLTAHRFGVRRVLLANQPVAPSELAALFALLQQDPDFDVIVLVDSAAGLARLAGAATLTRPLSVMVELGWVGGRTGCRGLEAALQLARDVAAAPGLALCGIEGYEGLLVSGDKEGDARRVRAFLEQMLALLNAADAEGLFSGAEILLSAGGSAYFDLVGEVFATLPALSRPLRRVLRSGCYLTHDHGFYQKLLMDMAARSCADHAHHITADGLQPALEVWAMVQGCPEPDLVMLTLGKRDASYDIDLPFPVAWHRPGSTEAPLPLAGAAIEKMNDQHAYLRLPARHGLLVGDLVCCGISHPCTTFDKWKTLLTVDDDYRVTGVVNTFF